MRAVLAALVAVLALVLGACSEGGAPSQPAAPASVAPAPTTPAVSKWVTYDSVAQLKVAVVDAGYPCPNWKEDSEPGPKFARDSGSCSDEDVFSTYSDVGAVQKQREIGEGLINMLVGPNWIINIPEKHRALVQNAIGGEHVPGEIDEDPTEEPSASGPKKSDFKLKVKVTDKECFGSAGCLVDVKLKLEYSGDSSRLPEGTIDLTYKVTGDEDGPVIGTIELETPDGNYSAPEESLTTRSSSTKIRAKITDLEVNS